MKGGFVPIVRIAETKKLSIVSYSKDKTDFSIEAECSDRKSNQRLVRTKAKTKKGQRLFEKISEVKGYHHSIQWGTFLLSKVLISLFCRKTDKILLRGLFHETKLSVNSSEAEHNLLLERKTRGRFLNKVLRFSTRWNFALSICHRT